MLAPSAPVVFFYAAQPAYDGWLKEFPAMTATIAEAAHVGVGTAIVGGHAPRHA